MNAAFEAFAPVADGPDVNFDVLSYPTTVREAIVRSSRLQLAGIEPSDLDLIFDGVPGWRGRRGC